jgi:hypothetical protein
MLNIMKPNGLKAVGASGAALEASDDGRGRDVAPPPWLGAGVARLG